MKFSLWRRGGQKGVMARSAQEEAEKLVVEGFRVLGQLCSRLADVLEAQRLERSGYKDQGKFLERLDEKDKGASGGEEK